MGTPTAKEKNPMRRIKQIDIDNQIKIQVRVWGYERYHIGGRNGYYAIDEMGVPTHAPHPTDPYYTVPNTLRTYKAGITRKQAYELVNALIEGAQTVLKKINP